MAPQARCKLPPELGGLMRRDMEMVIYQSNLGREDAKIAQLYFVDKLPQVDVATELYLGRATVQRRLPDIMARRGLGSYFLVFLQKNTGHIVFNTI